MIGREGPATGLRIGSNGCGCCAPSSPSGALHVALSRRAAPESGVSPDLAAPATAALPSLDSGNGAGDAHVEAIAALNASGVDRLILLRGGCVVTMDPAVPDLILGDVLIRGRHICQVAPAIEAPDAQVIDATGCIVMPGFVDSHRHLWTNVLRRWAPNAVLAEYRVATNHLSGVVRPSDVYAGELLACVSAMEAGITTMLDWSHIPITPEHNDAAIEALRHSGMRTVYGYGPSRANHAGSQYPHDIHRIRKRWFSSDDQLCSLNLAADVDTYPLWQIARDLDLRITAHLAPIHEAAFHQAADGGLIRDDVYFIHCTGLQDRTWQRMADAGSHVSVSPSGTAILGIARGLPAIQRALDHGIVPSLSGDTEVSEPGDFFTEMRLAFCLQRGMIHEAIANGAKDAPRLVTVREIIAMATIEGARTLGLEHRTGSITPGKDADIQLLRFDELPSMPLNNVMGNIVFAADRQSIEMVMVAGKIVKWHGRMMGVDQRHLAKLVTEARDWVIERSGYALDPLGDGFTFASAGAPDPSALIGMDPSRVE